MGSRVLTGTSSFDLACVVAFGAILGRTVLLADPTLAIGVVALTTFIAVQALLGLLRSSPALYRWLNHPPVLLASDGRLIVDNMRRAHVVEDECGRLSDGPADGVSRTWNASFWSATGR
jgi:uncharacterized membrane protein YcaP (DUF421 family)